MGERPLPAFAIFLSTPNIVLKEEKKFTRVVSLLDGTTLQFSAAVASAPENSGVGQRYAIRVIQCDVDHSLKDAATIDFCDTFSLLSAIKYFVRIAKELEGRDLRGCSYQYQTNQKLSMAFWATEDGELQLSLTLGEMSRFPIDLTIDQLRGLFHGIKECRDCLIEYGAKNEVTE